ncbi:MAG TPA: hypothetical protein VNT51_00970 [Miltoncostaeaceae bacterium]|nr:hypothetical protein [Miltoncostaeaceae bacterium]
MKAILLPPRSARREAARVRGLINSGRVHHDEATLLRVRLHELEERPVPAELAAVARAARRRQEA